MFTHGQLYQMTSTVNIQLRVYLKYKGNIIIISSKVSCSRNDIDGNVAFDIKQ